MHRGFSLIEVLLVVAILGILLLAAYFFAFPQLARGRDGRRMSDLNKLKIAFEDYYNDNSCYPPSDILELYCGGSGSTKLDPYMNSVPCDPKTKAPYLYSLVAGEQTPSCPTKGYRLLADLERDNSEASVAINCGGTQGCGFTNYGIIYDYGVAQGVAVSIVDQGGGAGGGGGGGSQDWCCILSTTPTCTQIINGSPSSCDRDYHGVNAEAACIANCIIL